MKRDAARWRTTGDAALTTGSLLAPLLIGIALADLLGGLPINSSQDYTGSFWDLLQPYAVFTGIAFVLVCLLHGATFLSLKTTAERRERSRLQARRVAPVTAAVIGFIIWAHVTASSGFFLNLIELTAILAVLAALWLVYVFRKRVSREEFITPEPGRQQPATDGGGRLPVGEAEGKGP